MDEFETTDLTLRQSVLAGIAGLVGVATIARAGPLDPPPGPITSTGKTLTEVEPRIAVTAANTPGDATAVFAITQPGSYYLTGNVNVPAGKTGVRITASNVTLDLRGFMISGGPAAGATAIFDAGTAPHHVTIRNGTVCDVAGEGISLATAVRPTVEDLTAKSCQGPGVVLGAYARLARVHAESNAHSVGATGAGIRAGSDAVLDSCSAYSNSGAGMQLGDRARIQFCVVAKSTRIGIESTGQSSVHACVVADSGNIGIFGGKVVSSCALSGNTFSGVSVSDGTVQGCAVRATRGTGISGTGSSIEDCAASLSTSPTNVGHGFHAQGSTVSNCAAYQNAGYGVDALGVVRIAHCAARRNVLDGIVATGGALVVHNSCSDNGTLGLGSGAGVRIRTGASSRIEGNLCTGNSSWGIAVQTAGNMIVGNVCSLNTTNWSITANNVYGSIVDRTAAAGGGMAGNGTVASTLGSVDPFGNFSM